MGRVNRFGPKPPWRERDLAAGAVTAAKIAKTTDGALDLSGAVAEGKDGTASALYTHAEGELCVASAQGAHAEGDECEATGAYAHAEGEFTAASGAHGAHAEGTLTAASGGSSHAEGGATVASGVSSHAEGTQSNAYLNAQHAHAGGWFVAAGDAQHSRIVLKEAITHDDTAWHTIDGHADAAIPTDTLWTFDILLSGATVGLAKTFSYHIIGSIENDGDATTLNSMTVTTIHETDSDFDAQVIADDTNDALAIQVKDTTSGSDVVRWVADVRLCEVGFPAA